MIEAIAASDELRQHASEIRRRKLADSQVRRAVTLWSAIMRGYDAGIRHAPDDYLPQDDARMHERANAILAGLFYGVMGTVAPPLRSSSCYPRAARAS